MVSTDENLKLLLSAFPGDLQITNLDFWTPIFHTNRCVTTLWNLSRCSCNWVTSTTTACGFSEAQTNTNLECKYSHAQTWFILLSLITIMNGNAIVRTIKQSHVCIHGCIQYENYMPPFEYRLWQIYAIDHGPCVHLPLSCVCMFLCFAVCA